MRFFLLLSAVLLFSPFLRAELLEDLRSASQRLIAIRQGLSALSDEISVASVTNGSGASDYSGDLAKVNSQLLSILLDTHNIYSRVGAINNHTADIKELFAYASSAPAGSLSGYVRSIKTASDSILEQVGSISGFCDGIGDYLEKFDTYLTEMTGDVGTTKDIMVDIASLFEEMERYIIGINNTCAQIATTTQDVLIRLDGIFSVRMIDEQWGVIDKALIDFQKSFDGALAELKKISNNTQNEGSHGFGSDQQEQLDKIANRGITANVDLTPVLNAMEDWRDSQSEKLDDIRSWSSTYFQPLFNDVTVIANNVEYWGAYGFDVHVKDLPGDLYETIRTRSDVMWDELEPYLKKLVTGGGTNALSGATDNWFEENGDTVKKYWVDTLEDKDEIFKESIKQGFDAGNWWQRYGGDNYTWFHLAGDSTNVSEAVNSPLEMDFVDNWYDAVVALLHQNGTIAADINKILYSTIGDASSAEEERQEDEDYISDAQREYGGEEGWRGHVQFDRLSNFVEGHKVGAADNVANALSLGEGSIAEQLSLVLPAYTYGDFNLGTDDMTITQTDLPSAFTTVIEGCHAVSRFCWYSLAVSIHFFFLWLFVKLARSEVISKLVSVEEGHMVR